jgi:hypothetical protein
MHIYSSIYLAIGYYSFSDNGTEFTETSDEISSGFRCMYIDKDKCVYIHAYVYTFLYVVIHIYICLNTCICIYLYIYIYIYV